MSRRRIYTNEELLHRPVEHILEDLSQKTLGEVWGMSHTQARERKRGAMRVTREQDERLREWLRA